MAGALGRLLLAYVTDRRDRKELEAETAAGLRYRIGLFVDFVGWDFPVHRVTERHVQRWLAQRNVAPATLRNDISALRNFMRWLIENGHMKRDPMAFIKPPKTPRRIPRSIQKADADAVIDEAPDERALLVLSLMLQEGLRCVEVARLQVHDFDMTEQIVLVVGKARHERVLPFSDQTRHALVRYLAAYPASAGPLIRSYRNPHAGLTKHYISRLASKWLHNADVDATGHQLRHTFASDLIRGGAPLRDVQAALGHSSLKATEVYLPLEVQGLRKAMEGRKYGSDR